MLAYQQKESTARVASIMENTNLSKQQQVSEIMRQMLTQAQTAGQYFTNDQIKEMTRSEERFSRNAETDLVCRLLLENKMFHQPDIGRAARGGLAGSHLGPAPPRLANDPHGADALGGRG